jgi:hypothetical protein
MADEKLWLNLILRWNGSNNLVVPSLLVFRHEARLIVIDLHMQIHWFGDAIFFREFFNKPPAPAQLGWAPGNPDVGPFLSDPAVFRTGDSARR